MRKSRLGPMKVCALDGDLDKPDAKYTVSAWTSITKDDIDSPASAYLFGKTQAERAVWEFAAEHKHIDVTVGKCAKTL